MHTEAGGGAKASGRERGTGAEDGGRPGSGRVEGRSKRGRKGLQHSPSTGTFFGGGEGREKRDLSGGATSFFSLSLSF